MKKNRLLKIITICASIFVSNTLSSQEIIYQQNFDGNNGNFSNTVLSSTSAINGWLTNSTAAQYGNYKHLWNFSNITTGNNPDVLPISNRSLGMGFFNGNAPNIPNQFFRTWDGDEPASDSFFTTRWAHVGVSTVGYENITVEFKWRCTGEVDNNVVYDYGTINTSIDGGTTWLMDQTGGQGGKTGEHGTFSSGLYFGNPDVKTTTLTLPSNRNNQANFRLAFRMVVDEGYGTGGSFIIDDIIIRGTKITLGTTNTEKKAIIETYRNGNDFIIKSPTIAIQQIDIYDSSGKLVIHNTTKEQEVRVSVGGLNKGIYILKAHLKNGEVLTTKIKI